MSAAKNSKILSSETVVGFIAGAAVGFSVGNLGKGGRQAAADQAVSSARQTADDARGSAERAASSAKGAAAEARSSVSGEQPAANDETLADRVRSQAFRSSGAPEGAVNVNVEAGIVYLRGELPDADAISALITATKEVEGVDKVENLLHTPGEPAPHKQETEDETRRRVEEQGGYAAP